MHILKQSVVPISQCDTTGLGKGRKIKKVNSFTCANVWLKSVLPKIFLKSVSRVITTKSDMCVFRVPTYIRVQSTCLKKLQAILAA